MKLPLLAWCILLLACQRPNAPAAAAARETVPSAPAVAAPAPTPAAHEPLQPAAPAAAGPTTPAHAGGLTWNDTSPFVRLAPKSSMRAAEYSIRDETHAEFAVYYFGPDQGGSVEANITRWLGQFTQTDGSDSAAKAKRTTREVGNIKVNLLEVAGAYAGGMPMPGAPRPEPQADAMLLAAIANGPNGPVFFKLVGPRESIEHSKPGFDQMIGSLHEDTGTEAKPGALK